MNITYRILILLLLSYSSYTDIKSRVVMMIPVYTCFFIGAVGIIYPVEGEVLSFAGIIPGIVLLLVASWTKGAVGDGDAYIVMIIGMFMGIKNVFCILLIGSFLSAIYGVIILMRKKNKNEAIPFVPFLLSGYLGVLLIA